MFMIQYKYWLHTEGFNKFQSLMSCDSCYLYIVVLKYRVTIPDGNNLLLTWFRQSWQLVGSYCSYLLPRQDDGTFQIQVNRRLLPSGIVTL